MGWRQAGEAVVVRDFSSWDRGRVKAVEMEEVVAAGKFRGELAPDRAAAVAVPTPDHPRSRRRPPISWGGVAVPSEEISAWALKLAFL